MKVGKSLLLTAVARPYMGRHDLGAVGSCVQPSPGHHVAVGVQGDGFATVAVGRRTIRLVMDSMP